MPPTPQSPFDKGSSGNIGTGTTSTGAPGPGFYYSTNPAPSNDGGQAINYSGTSGSSSSTSSNPSYNSSAPAYNPSGNTSTGAPGPGFYYGTANTPSNDGGQAIVR